MSAAADRIRHIIAEKHAQGWSEQRVKSYLVAQYGEELFPDEDANSIDQSSLFTVLCAVMIKNRLPMASIGRRLNKISPQTLPTIKRVCKHWTKYLAGMM